MFAEKRAHYFVGVLFILYHLNCTIIENMIDIRLLAGEMII
jgi:hypothetical protein